MPRRTLRRMLVEGRDDLLLKLAAIEPRRVPLDLEEVERSAETVLAHEVDFLLSPVELHSKNICFENRENYNMHPTESSRTDPARLHLSRPLRRPKASADDQRLLGTGEDAIKKHLKAIYSVINVANRAEATNYAIANKLIG